ncbi:hypothetical protein CROQUDRAFT_658951 [Cronartium quercuum f. sp. fusiforme G11]|uniref:ARM repeat superfamily protein n=1 Tax=Cronartium quercuum f. sp. fusiforme G11 TaxID=708437 RepID=A0A9P6TAJ6_9BASI|nr:hypothetical protein CROQUDRAFT_658951 [Cronartium quercuum f. sp. fusiforme G11]
MAYGVATILKHLTAYKQLKSPEDEAADRLRKLATQSKTVEPKIEELDEDEQASVEDEQVFEWIMSMLMRNNELMEIMGELVKTESKEVRRTAARVLLNLIERQECRGKVLQTGGARMLLKIIASLTVNPGKAGSTATSPISSSSQKKQYEGELEPTDLPMLQALAKLLITTNPLLVFGPSPDSPLLLSALKPLITLLTHPASSLLQLFEGLMSLTNMASLSSHLAALIASSPRVLEKIEECMIGVRTGEHELIRRAATELLCNLASTQAILETFEEGPTSARSRSRLHLLIALSSSDDLPTALAAAGALALLVDHSSAVAKALVNETKLSESLGRVALDIIEEGKIGVQHRLITLLACMLEEDQDRWTKRPVGLKDALEKLKGRLGEEDEVSAEVRRLVGVVLHRLDE